MKPEQKKPTSSLDGGRIPPQNIGFEEAVIGAMLIDQKCLTDLLGMLDPEVFYRPQHRLIFQAIKDLYHEGSPVDILTVAEKLRKKGELEAAGSEYSLIELSNKVSSTAHSENHALKLKEAFVKRELIKVGMQMIDQSFDETTDIFDLIADLQLKIEGVNESTIISTETQVGDLIDPEIERAEKIYQGKINPGIPTTCKVITQQTGGWRKGELIIIAARPGMGKTAYVIAEAVNAAKLGYPTAVFSLEMSEQQLVKRIISGEARIPGDKFNITGLSGEEALQAAKATQTLKSLPLFIEDNPAHSIQSIRIRAKQLVAKHGIQLIIIDYIQIMLTKGKRNGNREQEISAISRGLKLLSKELGVPVIALSQLSRAVEAQAGHKRPMLSHLRESGAIEQDADMVGFIYRPEYYNIIYWGEEDYENGKTENQAEIIIAKNRNGGLARTRMHFEKEFALFSDFETLTSNQFPTANHQDFEF